MQTKIEITYSINSEEERNFLTGLTQSMISFIEAQSKTFDVPLSSYVNPLNCYTASIENPDVFIILKKARAKRK